MESQESPIFNYMLPVKICQAILKLWQVKHEIKIKIVFLAKFVPTFELLN